MAKVALTNVHKIYPGDKGKDVTAVRDFNIEIADREFVVFVGPSGCGKSTTLRMIAGLEEISRGDIFIGEKRVNDVPPRTTPAIRDASHSFPEPSGPASR